MSWIYLSVMAAAFQTLRFMLQKRLSMGTLSAGGATLARFFYTAPFVTLLAAGYLLWRGQGVPEIGPRFWVYVLSGGIAQILATWCVVAIFASRNFAVGITFKKTEVMLTALVGFVVLGDMVTFGGLMAIGLGLVGVLVLSDIPEGAGGLLRRAMNRAAGLGILSGVLFAVSAVAYRGATLEVQAEDALMRALVAMPCVTIFQTLALSAYLRWREVGEVGRVVASWRTSVWMGLAGMGGSICWFTAFAMMNAAYVFAVGQVEVIFSIIVSVWFFNEVITRREWVGMALITMSVLALVWLH
ncbi:DMT family transporter [Lentibacter sp. XHP0401]|jgi:drug/metabolite transporter (DMT)-like permease|uniref:DMT family transporter n=1 Tax=Lentibacter sp. XHP0401 TaxID=2984334 RepID=UPI0021E976C7|nr:DMT family transporter [Lentibacter sp. XHP0401]MCV2893011.1 DMT family transporter [Lentibacter sp. XHP0401]